MSASCNSLGEGEGAVLLVSDVNTPSGAFTSTSSDYASRMNVEYPCSVAPSNNQLFRPSLLLRLNSRLSELVCIMSSRRIGRVIIGFQGSLVDPLYARLPNTSHVVPCAPSWSIYVADTFPSKLDIGRFEVEMGTHNLDTVFIDPRNKLARSGELDCAYAAFAGVEHCIFTRALTESKPSGSCGGSAVGVGIGTDTSFSAHGEDKISREATGKIASISLVLGREGDSLDGASEVAQSDILGIDE